MTPSSPSCDIFCRVVDNYGDIGVTRRLSRQLAHEHGVQVRLLVDDLSTFAKLAPAVRKDQDEQTVDRVTVIRWSKVLDLKNAADLVIEAFACELPGSYLEAMARRNPAPVWLNLEYLSAEPWVAGHHLLPSPHPYLPLTKYFFFPGFERDTGGLIRETGLLAARKAFSRPISTGRLNILLFAYPTAPAEALLDAFASGPAPVACHVPEGALADKLKHWRAVQAENAPEGPSMLDFEIVPFVPQQEFDALLWRQDVLFVRGEDSFVRAIWAAKPFVWQIYPQGNSAHMKKLDAFLDIYCQSLPDVAAVALRGMWIAWNKADADAVGVAWQAFVDQLPALTQHACKWAQSLSEMPDLASNLLSFFRKNTKI